MARLEAALAAEVAAEEEVEGEDGGADDALAADVDEVAAAAGAAADHGRSRITFAPAAAAAGPVKVTVVNKPVSTAGA